jgi:hypothetical protein
MSAAGELAALAQMACAFPLRGLGAHTLGDVDAHPVPVVLVHGILGDTTNFFVLRRHLVRNGIRRFSSFAYVAKGKAIVPKSTQPRVALAMAREHDARLWLTRPQWLGKAFVVPPDVHEVARPCRGVFVLYELDPLRPD